MATTAHEFLDHLASNNLVPPEVLESLRRQVGKAARPVSAASVARLLVDRGHLTTAQGERLVGGPLPAAAPKQEEKGAKTTAPKSSSSSGVLGLEPLGDAPAAEFAKSSSQPAVRAPSESQEIDLLAGALGLAPIEPPKPAGKPPLSGNKLPSPARPPSAPQAKPKENVPSLVEGLLPLDDFPVPSPKPAPAPKAPFKGAPSKSGIGSTGKPAAASPAAIAKTKPAVVPEAGIQGLDPLAPLPADDLFGATAPPDLAATDLLTPASAAPQAATPLTSPQAASRGPLWLVIAGIALAALVTGGAAAFFLTRSNGDQEFELAEQEYQAQQYSSAVARFDELLEDYPGNSHAGQARLHRGMAQIMAASPARDNWTAILPVAKKSLAEISQEPDLPQLHAELAPLLTDMAAGLMEQARQGKTAHESSERLVLAKEALALANDSRFVPGTLRQWQRLSNVEESLALLERDLGRGKALEAALAEIKTAAQAGKVDAAFTQRTKLLQDYPELGGDVALRDRCREIARSAAESVKSGPYSSRGEAAEEQSPIEASLSLATAKETTAAMTPGQTFFALAGGSVSALDGGSGKLLWQRPVGLIGGSAVIALSADAGSDVLLADLAGDEVLCVDRRSGAIRWRHIVEGHITGEMLAAGGRVFIATRDGKLIALDAESGDGKSAAQLPQHLRLGPVASDGKHIYQLAEHSLLYVLAAADLKCNGAVYLGHEPGSVEVTPTVLARHLVVAENRGSSALLHVVPLDDKGTPADSSQKVEIEGKVTTSPLLLGDRLIVLTDRQSAVFDYLPAEEEPLKKLGETAVAAGEPLARYGLVHAGKLWVADDGLRKFDFVAAGGTLKEAWAGFAGDAVDALPQAADDTIFCVRRAGGEGAIATALKASSGEPLWETQLAEPLVSLAVAADGQSVMAVSASGGETKIELASFEGRSVIQSVPAAPQRLVQGASLAAPPIAWGGGMLCVTASGSVQLLESQSGAPLAEPFQLSIKPGTRLANCSAVAGGKYEQGIVISDGQTGLYHLRLEKEPQPHLVQVAKTSLKAPIISPAEALADDVFVVDKSGALHVLSLPDLKAARSSKLNCHAILFGPARVGKVMLLATDRDELVCYETGKELWKLALPDGHLAGRPLVVGSDLILATKSGKLLRIAADSGREIARADLRQTLSGSPALLAGAALIPTAAGRILKVSLPEKE